MDALTGDHWSEYWSQGQATSLPQDFAANYDGEVQAFWERHFALVPDGGSVLDICSGNGAVALLAARHFEPTGREVTITAIDAAAMDPAALARRFPAEARYMEGIEFKPQMPVESLDFSDGSFDLVTSQYGFEYCDWAPAAGQVTRVLKSGGRFVMVCHHPGSEILSYMRTERGEYAALEELGFIRAARAWLNGDADVESLRSAWKGVHQALGERLRERPSALFASILGLLSNALRMPTPEIEARREALDHYLYQFESGRNRLEDMWRVNEALAGDEQWTRCLTDAGLDFVETGELRYRESHHAGVFHVFEKS
ncbi:MAG: class I SAM-dependent methyltransferase [Xanthomonadales bacterium]|nr:class I SAM-dependent methyltransferase [Xanthomonadales bacterium]